MTTWAELDGRIGAERTGTVFGPDVIWRWLARRCPNRIAIQQGGADVMTFYADGRIALRLPDGQASTTAPLRELWAAHLPDPFQVAVRDGQWSLVASDVNYRAFVEGRVYVAHPRAGGLGPRCGRYRPEQWAALEWSNG